MMQTTADSAPAVGPAEAETAPPTAITVRHFARKIANAIPSLNVFFTG